MISKDKMFIIAGNIDDSIKAQTTVYDVTIFKTLIEFERFVDVTPVVVDTIIITTDVLPFSGRNISRLISLMESPFLKLTGNLIYLINIGYAISDVNKFIEEEHLNWVVYQGDLTSEFIAGIVSGEGRVSTEVQQEIITYRVRASEYVRQQNVSKADKEFEDTTNHYRFDDELLADIPDEDEPEDINPVEVSTRVFNIVGEDLVYRPLMAFLVGQYLSLSETTLLLERDLDFHMLTELVVKAGVPHFYIDVEELEENFQKALIRIKGVQEKLIIIGSKKRKQYNYSFMIDTLYSVLKGDVQNIIKESDFTETPYGVPYTVVMDNTIPAVLKTCNMLKHDIDEKLVNFIGMQIGTLGPVDLTSKEMEGLVSFVLGKNEVSVQVMKLSGINLKGDDGKIYDIFSFLKRGYVR